MLVAQWGGAALRAGLMPQSAAVLGVQRRADAALHRRASRSLVGLLTGLAPVVQSRRVESHRRSQGRRARGRAPLAHTRRPCCCCRARCPSCCSSAQDCSSAASATCKTSASATTRSRSRLLDLNMRGVKLDSAHDGRAASQAARAREDDPRRRERESLQTSIPFWSTWSVGLYVEGIDTVGKLGQFDLNAVSPDYFSTLGTRIIRGRGFTTADDDRRRRARSS